MSAVLSDREPVEIIPQKLYVGHKRNAASVETLKALSITHVLNTTADVPHYFPDIFVYKRVGALWVRQLW